MSNTGNTAIPAGWYPDPEGSTRARWWDGSVWTDQFESAARPDPYAAPAPYGQPISQLAPYQAATALTAPEGTSPYTPFIWILAALPVLNIIANFVFFVSGGLAETTAMLDDPEAPLFYPGEVATNAVQYLVIALSILFAVLDYRALKAAGVPGPFHWAYIFFVFFSAPVYVVGRSIIIRRRTGSGLRPMVLNIALIVAHFVLVFIWAIIVLLPEFAEIMETTP
jgi:hypothetical protein